jgi:hypothetical protein
MAEFFMPNFRLLGFTDIERPNAELATRQISQLLFPNGYPPLKSEVIDVERISGFPTPLYAGHLNREHIIVNCQENYPWQYSYQLSHELGHLATRSDLRYPRKDGNMWIEEALCGAYSVHALKAMSQAAGPLQWGAQQYVRDGLAEYRYDAVNSQWMDERLADFRPANTLTPDLQKLAGYIAANLPIEQVISDNCAIRHIPLNENLDAYLSDWDQQCEGDATTPRLLQDLLPPKA